MRTSGGSRLSRSPIYYYVGLARNSIFSLNRYIRISKYKENVIKIN